MSNGVLLAVLLGTTPLPYPVPAPPLVRAQPVAYLLPLLALVWLIPAAVALRRARRRDRAEEDNQTPYAEEELMQHWEFKIIRHRLGRFDRAAYLEQVLKEEAQAGWQLVEKFDGRRVRLKRAAPPRPGDAALPRGYDPYRTRLGPSDMKLGLWAAAGTCAVCGFVFVVLAVLTSPQPFFWSLAAVGGALLLLFGVVGAIIR
jgi:hypothetical protein